MDALPFITSKPSIVIPMSRDTKQLHQLAKIENSKPCRCFLFCALPCVVINTKDKPHYTPGISRPCRDLLPSPSSNYYQEGLVLPLAYCITHYSSPACRIFTRLSSSRVMLGLKRSEDSAKSRAMSELREMQIIAACPHAMCKSPPPYKGK
jgi:hypothetical protein